MNFKMFIESKNMFGMMKPSKRKQVSSGAYHGGEGIFQAYSSRWQSIHDYFLRQEEFNIPVKDYMLETVVSGYAADNDYLVKWESTYKNTSQVMRLVFLFPLALGFFIIWRLILLIKIIKKYTIIT